MKIKSAEFIVSALDPESFPKTTFPEFAFIGRSNVGKSSLINMLTGKNGLAKVSGTPGKTQLINFFNINDRWYLVDLPGYGYAKVSKTQQKKLAAMIEGYLFRRTPLMVAFVLIDSNVPPTRADLDFVNQLGAYEVPFALAFTKTDRHKKGVLDNNVEAFLEALRETWDTLPTHFITSSKFSTGREEILDYIAKLLKTKPA